MFLGESKELIETVPTDFDVVVKEGEILRACKSSRPVALIGGAFLTMEGQNVRPFLVCRGDDDDLRRYALRRSDGGEAPFDEMAGVMADNDGK